MARQGTKEHSSGFAGFGVLLISTVFITTAAPTGTYAAPSSGTPSTTDRAGSGDVIVEPETSPSDPSRPPLGTRFECQVQNGQYTVMYQPESQPGQLYPWAVPSAMGGGWDSARRCYEISRRLESYRPDGLLEMRTGIENGYNTICVTTERSPGCRIVLTVPPGQDPLATRDRVFQNLTIADGGQQTQGVTTFVEGGQSGGLIGEAARLLNINLPGLGSRSSSNAMSGGINLRPFLDQADGGTGQYLRQGRAATPGRRLNPNRFR